MKNEKFHYRINKFKNLIKKFYESVTTSYYILFQNKDLKDIILKNRRFLSNCGPFLKSQEFVNKVDLVTFEFENIPFETLEFISQSKEVKPKPAINKIVQHRLYEKDFVNTLFIYNQYK